MKNDNNKPPAKVKIWGVRVQLVRKLFWDDTHNKVASLEPAPTVVTLDYTSRYNIDN